MIYEIQFDGKPCGQGFLDDCLRNARPFTRFDRPVAVVALDHLQHVALALEEISREAIGGRPMGDTKRSK